MTDFTLLDCKHRNTHFVSSSRGMGDNHLIRVCKDCGEIMIRATKDGVHFKLDFHIHNADTVDSLRSWVNYVNENG